MAKVLLGPETGQVVKDGKVVRTDQMIWCLMCLRKKIQNHQIITKEDKKYIDSCLMKEWVTMDKEGLETRGKTCHRCQQTIILEGKYWNEAKRA